MDSCGDQIKTLIMSHIISIKLYPLDQDPAKLWFIEFRLDNGKKLKKYGNLAKLATLKEKQDEATRLMEEIRETYGGEREKLSSDSLVRQIEKNFQIRSIYIKPKSVSTYNTKILHFVTWYRAHHNTAEVRETGLGHAYVKYLKGQNLSHTTINSYRETIKQFWPKKMDNPFLETFKLIESRTSFLYFNEAQQQELSFEIARRNPQLWLACEFQFYLLLRPNELRTIKCGQFLLDEQRLRVDGVDAKNNKTMFVAIPDELSPQLEILRQYPPYFYALGNKGKPGIKCWNKKHFSEQHQAILKQLGYNTNLYKFYSWKHTGAVMWYLKTGDIKSLQMQGRWHSMDMVNEYLKNVGVMDVERIKTDFPKIGGSGAAVIKIAN